jgi:hypothetical protein
MGIYRRFNFSGSLKAQLIIMLVDNELVYIVIGTETFREEFLFTQIALWQSA